jgi:hypothetical protein
MKVLLLALMLIAMPSAHAFNKCVNAEGKTTYTDEPCPEKSTNPSAKTNPTQKNEPAVSTGPLSSAFVKYTNSVKSGNWLAYLDSLSAKHRAKAEPHGEKTLPIVKAMLPSSVTVVDESIAEPDDKGTLRIKGVMAMLSDKEQVSYGTIELVKESGAWKIDQQGWSNNAWKSSGTIKQEGKDRQVASCAGVTGKPESLPDQDMVKLMPGETQVAKFALEPNGKKEIRHPATSTQDINFRVAHNRALACKFGDKYPVEMKVGGEKYGMASFAAGLKAEPVNGVISLSFKNMGQETMNFLVASSRR